MNRFFRRLQRFGGSFAERRRHGRLPYRQDSLAAPSTPQDVSSPRAKSSGHGKSTADKWNQ